jgi:extracellular elastinolytic metalloproteinase
MGREVDLRAPAAGAVPPGRADRLEALADEASGRLPGEHRVRVAALDGATGNPSRVESSAAPAERGDEIRRALAHVGALGGALGLAEGQPPEFVPDPAVQRTSGGAAVVHLQQRFAGIPIFQAADAVRFDPDGSIVDVVGTTVTVDGHPSPLPARSVEDAALLAARHCATPAPDEAGGVDAYGQPLAPAGVELGDFRPRVITAFTTSPEQPAVLEPGPFDGELTARLVWFPLSGALRLAWEVILALPGGAGQYRTLVDAQDAEGTILYCRDLTLSLAARGNVYTRDGAGAREMVDFPRPLGDYPVPAPAGLPEGFPDPWLAADQTSGNSVHAHLGDDGPAASGAHEGDDVVFDPADATGDDQKVLNIFYFNCYMHDLFYLLGFTEPHYNFQRDNLGRGGRGGDPVDARSFPGPVWGTASMSRSTDGRSATMRMGLVAQTGRHTAFDSSVVFHEYAHGVSNRLVGGGMDEASLDAPQSAGANEGISDFVACTVNGTTVVGDWVTGTPGGIRAFPYDADFPDSFGDLGSGRYDGSPPHPIGEIWCATLMEMSRAIGGPLSLQILIDGLKLAPTNPSFLDLRDAILMAAGHLATAGGGDPEALERDIWAAFAKLGMGPEAQSDGPFLTGIVPDFAPPGGAPQRVLEVEARPDVVIPDFDPAGVRSSLVVAEDETMASVGVSVEITHPFVGDLRIRVITPAGATIMLSDRGEGMADLRRVFRAAAVPALGELAGTSTRGEWTLWASDHTGRDVGRLVSWGLMFVLE